MRDATVLILPPATVSRFRRRGIDLRVLTPLRVLAVTANPFRFPQPYNPKIFFGAVADAVGDRAPVFDVVNGLARVPAGAAEPQSQPQHDTRPKEGVTWSTRSRSTRRWWRAPARPREAIADDIQQHIDAHTTDTTERATLRLLGIDGVNEIDVPLVNVVVEHARDAAARRHRCGRSSTS